MTTAQEIIKEKLSFTEAMIKSDNLAEETTENYEYEETIYFFEDGSQLYFSGLQLSFCDITPKKP